MPCELDTQGDIWADSTWGKLKFTDPDNYIAGKSCQLIVFVFWFIWKKRETVLEKWVGLADKGRLHSKFGWIFGKTPNDLGPPLESTEKKDCQIVRVESDLHESPSLSSCQEEQNKGKNDDNKGARQLSSNRLLQTSALSTLWQKSPLHVWPFLKTMLHCCGRWGFQMRQTAAARRVQRSNSYSRTQTLVLTS